VKVFLQCGHTTSCAGSWLVGTSVTLPRYLS
jgi:hypothetical protein